MESRNATNNFLHKAVQWLSSSEKFVAIRCNMLQNAVTDVSDKTLCMPPKVCSVCDTDFRSSVSRRQILPAKKRNRFMRRQILKQENNYRTQFQLHYRQRFLTRYYNKQILLIRCKVCKKKYRVRINKPGSIKQRLKLKKVGKKNSVPNRKIRRKKLKKNVKRLQDKFCGLNASAVKLAAKSFKKSNDSSVICLDDSVNPQKTPKKNKKNTQVIDLCDPPTLTDFIPLESPNRNNISARKKVKKVSKFQNLIWKKQIQPKQNVVLAQVPKVSQKTKYLNRLSSVLKNAKPQGKTNAKTSLQNFLQGI